MKFVFEAKIKEGSTGEEYVKAWQQGSGIIQQQPGALGTQLHQKVGDNRVFLAIATWESKDARDKAMSKLDEVSTETREILQKHEQYADIQVLGFFEEPEWIV